LSVLCGGLWWSINWFASELKAAQAKEDEAEKLRRRKKGGDGEWRSKGEVADSADDEGEETEVEESRTEAAMKGSTSGLSKAPPGTDDTVREEIREAMGSNRDNDRGSGVATGTEQAEGGAQTRQRRAEDVDRSGEISTDSEWEKVSQDGDR